MGAALRAARRCATDHQGQRDENKAEAPTVSPCPTPVAPDKKRRRQHLLGVPRLWQAPLSARATHQLNPERLGTAPALGSSSPARTRQPAARMISGASRVRTASAVVSWGLISRPARAWSRRARCPVRYADSTEQPPHTCIDHGPSDREAVEATTALVAGGCAARVGYSLACWGDSCEASVGIGGGCRTPDGETYRVCRRCGKDKGVEAVDLRAVGPF